MEYKNSFMQQCLSKSVETNYNDFKSFVDMVMDACIPGRAVGVTTAPQIFQLVSVRRASDPKVDDR